MSHIAVERNRRRQMNEHLKVLRSLTPALYIKRGDQASIIGGAIDFIRELQQVLESLEARKKRRSSGSGFSFSSSPTPSPRSHLLSSGATSSSAGSSTPSPPVAAGKPALARGEGARRLLQLPRGGRGGQDLRRQRAAAHALPARPRTGCQNGRPARGSPPGGAPP
ncbi:unnamed protein product [Urochloa humidicola]